MSRDFWTAAGAVLGILISAPLVMASVKAIFFFGQASQTVKVIEKRFEEHVNRMDTFIAEMHDFCDATNIRLTEIEADRRAEQKWGRRATDHIESPGERK